MADNNIIGYHGTSKTNAQLILRDGEFRFSNSDKEWLGKGVYFFQHSFHAKEWAVDHSGAPQNETAVLSALLSFDNNQILDLDDPAQLNLLNEFVCKCLSKGSGYIVGNLNTTDKWKKWCFECNLYRRFFTDIVVIAYTFHKRINETGYCINQRQICVSDNSVISNIQLEA